MIDRYRVRYISKILSEEACYLNDTISDKIMDEIINIPVPTLEEISGKKRQNII